MKLSEWEIEEQSRSHDGDREEALDRLHLIINLNNTVLCLYII